MDSTNNEIYKIAKYLDKYTKESNKEGGVYLQKLDNYLHKVQRGGGDVLDLAQGIGLMVARVVDEHNAVKATLEEMVGDVDGKDLNVKKQNKIIALQAEKERLETAIAQKQSARAASASHSPKAAAASSASNVITYDTLTRQNIVTINNIDLANIIINLLQSELEQDITNEQELQEQITKIGINTGQGNWWDSSNLLQKIYNGDAKDYFSQDNTKVILAIKITIALIMIKCKTLKVIVENTAWNQEIHELKKIIRVISSNTSNTFDKCVEIVSELFIDFVKILQKILQKITLENFNNFIRNDWRYLVSCTSDSEFTHSLFTREIITKEVCRRMNIIDVQEVQEIVKAFRTAKISWFVDSTRTFIHYLGLLYQSQYFKDNAELAINIAKELMKMKFNAIEIREVIPQKLSRLGIQNIELDKDQFKTQTGQINDIFEDINNDAGKINIFIDYVIKQNMKNSVPTVNGFREYVSELSKASPTLRETVPSSPEQAKQLAVEAVRQQQQLRTVSQKDPSNPFSKKFDIVGFTITKDFIISPYVIPYDQKEKVLEVLPQELRGQLGNADVQLLLENKKARIEFTNFLSIKETLRQINNRKDIKPTEFKTTGQKSGKQLNVWLFIVPMTYNLDQIKQENIQYFDAINKIEGEELINIAIIMEGIIKGRQS
jgi:hypothetical protein